MIPLLKLWLGIPILQSCQASQSKTATNLILAKGEQMKIPDIDSPKYEIKKLI